MPTHYKEERKPYHDHAQMLEQAVQKVFGISILGDI